MVKENSVKRSWADVFRSWLQPKALGLLFLGFSAGLPILLIFSTLSVWLREAGVERSAVTFFSWAALGYSFKFIWAPLVDLLPLPLLTRLLGRRRGWLLLSQCMIMAAIAFMASVNPAQGQNYLSLMAVGAVVLGFSSATQDIVIDAYRIECAGKDMQALLAAMYIAGYRVGMLVSGAGSLFLADYLSAGADLYNYGVWKTTYLSMAAIMVTGILTTLFIAEPRQEQDVENQRYKGFVSADYVRLFFSFIVCAGIFVICFGVFGGLKAKLVDVNSFAAYLDAPVCKFILETVRFFSAVIVAMLTARVLIRLGVVSRRMVDVSYVQPVMEFFHRYSWKAVTVILLLVGFYRVSDIVLGVVSNVFYLDLGFSKTAIAGITKSFGLGMTLLGGFLGGFLSVRFGVYKILMLGAVCSALTNFLFMLLAGTGADLAMLTVVIGADNLAAGIATTAFVAYLSSLTSVLFTAVQYAVFSSLMTLAPKVIGGYSGSIVTAMGYSSFFVITALLGIPVVVLVYIAWKMEEEREEVEQ